MKSRCIMEHFGNFFSKDLHMLEVNVPVRCVSSQFQRVVHLMSQKAWRIADLFSAVVQFCKLHEKEEEDGRSLSSSLFDWLLETL